MRSWKFWLGISVSLACIWYAFRDLDFGEFLGAISQANLLIVIPAMGLVLAIVWLRAWRWQFLLSHIKKISCYNLWLSALVGFGVNNLLPARIGELARCYTIRRVEGVPFASVFATVVVERMWDGLTVLFVLFLSFAFFDFPDMKATFGISQQALMITLGVSTAVIGVAFLLFRYLPNLVLGITEKLLSPFPKRLQTRILKLESTFIQGFQGLKTFREWGMTTVLSLVAWGLSAAGFWFVSLAFQFEVKVSLETLVMVMVAIVAAVTLPASPGYIGTYHIFGKKALMWGGFPPDQALALATVFHLVNYIPQTLGGLYGLKRQGLDIAKVRRIGEDEESAG